MEHTPSSNKINSYIIQSQEDEIKRIALELHENVGQTLYSVYTGLQFIETGIDHFGTKNLVKEMAQRMEKAIQEIRLLSVELYPPTLMTLGLLPALKSYSKLYTSTYGIIVDITSVGDELPILEPNKIRVYRVCQEAFVNIAKYADTSQASLEFTWIPNFLKIVIKDDGKGFNVEETMNGNHSSGLRAMVERMNLAGGECLISSHIGNGTIIEISLPLSNENK